MTDSEAEARAGRSASSPRASSGPRASLRPAAAPSAAQADPGEPAPAASQAPAADLPAADPGAGAVSEDPAGSPSAETAAAEPRAPRIVLDSAGVSRAVQRIAHEILERNRDIREVSLVAIVRGGIPIGRMLAARLEELSGQPVPLGELDITLYRDDVIGRGKRPVPRRTQMPHSVLGKRVVLIDDVVFTGRTIRAAMDAVIDFGRPQAIQVACLIDRGHRELPIQVGYVGKNIPTRREEEVTLLATGDGFEVHVA